jgi:hypothetical protein
MAGIETKVAAGSITTLGAGYLAGLLIEVVPWLKDNLTADQKQNLPIILAWILASVVAYFAPHTHRTDLPQPGVLLPLLPEIVPPGQPAMEDVPLPDDPSEHVSGRAGAAPEV